MCRVPLLAGHTSHSFVTLAIRLAAAWRVRVFIPYVRRIPAPFRGVASSTPFQYGYLAVVGRCIGEYASVHWFYTCVVGSSELGHARVATHIFLICGFLKW